MVRLLTVTLSLYDKHYNTHTIILVPWQFVGHSWPPVQPCQGLPTVIEILVKWNWSNKSRTSCCEDPTAQEYIP